MPPKRKIVSDDEDEYTDIDELISDGEEDVKPGDVRSILKGGLSQPMYSQFNMRHLHDMLHTGGVNLNPSYQRDVVWSEVKMIGLIQSLFLNYYIPAVMFAVSYDEDGNEIRTCIDGKQRCTSIVNFMDGKIPFISPHTKERYWYSMYGAKRGGLQLPDSLKRKFDQVQMQAVEYRDISDIQQRDIFQRVQLGMSLSTAEKLQAIPGPWPTWVIELVKKYVLEEGTLGDASVLQWDQRRGRPFQNLAGFIILGVEPDRTTVPSAQQIEKFFTRGDAPDRHLRHKVDMTLSLFINIATNHFAESFGVVEQRVAPVEFVFVALLIYTRMGIFSIARLASFIGKMRIYIRQEKGHVDVRSNTRISKDFADYVRGLPKKAYPGEPAAAEEFEGDEVDPRNIRAAKRARRGEEEDPTYRDTAVDRFDTAGLGNATRAAKAGEGSTNPPSSVVSAAARNRAAAAQLPPAPPVARPGPSSMDRQPIHIGGNYGQAAVPTPSTVNPYTVQYTGQQMNPAYSNGQNAGWGGAPNQNTGNRWGQR